MRTLSTHIACLAALTSFLHAGEKHAESFMFTRPLYDRIFTKISGDWPWIDAKKQNRGAQAIALYQTSNHSNKVDRYFLLNRQNNLLVAGDSSSLARERNVRAEWFGLPDTFSSVISVSPHQKQIGGWFEAEQELGALSSNHWISPFFVGIAFPFQHITNHMRFFEKDITNPGSDPADMRQAFDRKQLLFGKIGPKQTTSTRVPEILLRLGSHMLAHKRFVIDISGSVIIPTQKHQNPEYLFSPFFGHNGHVGMGLYVYFSMPLNECVETYDVSFFIAIDNAFFFKNKQYRSLDMRNKPWSRYMLVNNKNGTVVNEPAINIFTRKCTVHPFNIVDFTFGWHGHWRAITFDIGYNLWGHGREELRIKDAFEEVYGFAGSAPGKSANASTIDFQSADDLEFVPLRNQDLNTYTGESRSALSHTFTGSIGLRHCAAWAELIANVGGFYEMVQQNTSLPTWGVWFKIGITV